jgi:hypothetical protein
VPGYSLEDLDLRFRYTRWIFGIGMCAVIIILAALTYSALINLNRYFAGLEGPARFQLLPEKAIWWFLPGFGALCLGYEITLWLWSRFDDPQVVELYSYWSNQRAGFDSRKTLRWMALGISSPIAIFTVLAIPMHTTVDESDMRVRGYASAPSDRYSYSKIRQITAVRGYRLRDGSLQVRPAVIVDFADGRRWSSGDNREIAKNIDQNLLRFLEQKSGLNAGYAETESDVPTIAGKFAPTDGSQPASRP